VGESGAICVNFLGTFEHNLDDKLRLTIPSKFRNKIGQIIYVSKGLDGCLEVRTQESFDKWSAEISNHSNMSPNARLVSRQIYANTNEIEVDNSGRIKIPSNLLALANIKKSVLLLGVGDKIEIWDTNTYDEYLANAASFEEVAEKLGGAN
jgi:MraZ protein